MDREHGDRIGVGIELGRRRVVAGLDEGLEMAGHERAPVVGQHRRLGPDDVEEAGDVLDRLLRGRIVGGRVTGQPARIAQERVEDLARRACVGELRVATEVGDEPAQRRAGRRRQAEQAGLAVELLEDVPDRPVPPARAGDDRRQVVAAEAVHLGCGQGVHVDARAEVGDRPQEGEQQPDLGPGVQAGRPREPPGQPGDVEAAQDRVCLGVRPDEDRVVPRGRSAGDPRGDLPGEPVGLLGPAGERHLADRRGTTARRRFGTLGSEPLVDPRPDLQPIRDRCSG